MMFCACMCALILTLLKPVSAQSDNSGNTGSGRRFSNHPYFLGKNVTDFQNLSFPLYPMKNLTDDDVQDKNIPFANSATPSTQSINLPPATATFNPESFLFALLNRETIFNRYRGNDDRQRNDNSNNSNYNNKIFNTPEPIPTTSTTTFSWGNNWQNRWNNNNNNNNRNRNDAILNKDGTVNKDRPALRSFPTPQPETMDRESNMRLAEFWILQNFKRPSFFQTNSNSYRSNSSSDPLPSGPRGPNPGLFPGGLPLTRGDQPGARESTSDGTSQLTPQTERGNCTDTSVFCRDTYRFLPCEFYPRCFSCVHEMCASRESYLGKEVASFCSATQDIIRITFSETLRRYLTEVDKCLNYQLLKVLPFPTCDDVTMAVRKALLQFDSDQSSCLYQNGKICEVIDDLYARQTLRILFSQQMKNGFMRSFIINFGNITSYCGIQSANIFQSEVMSKVTGADSTSEFPVPFSGFFN